ncbi:MAG: zinc ABC transporter substrate-binding protein [Anaerolineae bacterium]|nr:zinc ABC transporter substrate-binding protein [Anaerolineae bacterium]
MRHRLRLLFPALSGLAVLVVLVLVSACSPAAQNSPATEEGSATINVVATIGMIADVVKTIGGEHVSVTQLMGAGVDPHLYTATQSDVTTLMDAQMIFYSGLHLEARMADVLEQIGKSKPVIAVGESVPEERRLVTSDAGTVDPHIWMDVSLWELVARKIGDELAAFDAANAAAYQANLEGYVAELQALDQYARDQIATIPEEQRVLVTAHDAFHYFSRAYGIEVFAPQGITTAAEAGVEDIRRTVQIIVERNIPAIFVESSVPPDIVDAIVAGAEAQGKVVTIGGSLFSDAMGQPGTPEGTYIGMIRHNVDTIVAALAGN